MGNLSEVGLLLGVFAAIIPILVVIFFFVMADNVAKMKKKMEEIALTLDTMNRKMIGNEKDLTT